MDLGNYVQAEDDFERALGAGHDNPKVRAACHLQLCCALLAQKDYRRAAQHFDAWKLLKPQLRNAFLEALEGRVAGAFREVTKDFVAHWSAQSHDPAQLERKLHAFLVDWATSRTLTDEAAAKLLKVSKQTFYNWRKHRESGRKGARNGGLR